MIYEIELSKLAFKNMSKIPKKELLRIRERIDALAVDPNPHDLKKITGEDNLYRIRSGNYRILYRIFESKLLILVVDVDHRKDVYKNF